MMVSGIYGEVQNPKGAHLSEENPVPTMLSPFGAVLSM